MASPLADGNVHARLIDPKPAASRIPRNGRHSPYSTNATGSPRVENVSPPSRNMVPPTVNSKLPRMSQTPTPLQSLRSTKRGGSVADARLSVPIQAARLSMAMDTPTVTGEKKVSPPSNRDKPLPSPPMAQVVNPNTPPKARRTLVDAESGSLFQSDWPILCPEAASDLANESINHLTTGFRNAKQNQNQQQQHSPQHRSASVGAAPKEISNPYFVNRKFKSSAAAEIVAEAGVDPAWVADTSPTRDAASRRPQSQQITQPRALGSNNPFANSYHAMSTGPEESIPSPLARKKSAPGFITIPPRGSSKRDSLPLSAQELEGRHSPEHKGEGGAANHKSTFEAERETVTEFGIRIRHLSRLGPGIGPVLTIYPDAEDVLRGPSDQVPEIPSPVLPGRPSSRLSRQRSLSNLAQKLVHQPSLSALADLAEVYSLHIKSRLSNSAIPESPSQRSDGGLSPGRVAPIRSMQPARKTVLGDLTSSPSPATSPIASSSKNNNPQQSHAMKPVTTDAASDSEYLEVEAAPMIEEKLTNDPDASMTVSLSLGISSDGGPVATAVHQGGPTKTISASLTSSNTVATSEAQNKTSPDLSSERQLSSRNATVKSSMSGTSSQAGVRLVKSHDATRSHGLSKLRATENATPIRSDRRATREAPSSFPLVNERPVAFVDFKTEEPIEKNVKGKRSIRNIFRRDNKHPELPQAKVGRKRSFMAETKSTLGKRLSSKSLSRVNLSLKQTSQPDLKSALKSDGHSAILPGTINSSGDVNRQAALSSLEASSFKEPANFTPDPFSDTLAFVNRIANQYTRTSIDASVSKRGIEAAEILLYSVECCKQAEMCARKAEICATKAERDLERARMNARDAELNVNQVHLGLKHHLASYQSDLDSDTLQYVRNYIRIVKLNRTEDVSTQT
ncbi:hypothetical protein T440DRAFT_305297 [Plenodomus tracheiphilus IPT5]|uniref:Uncharacterized protein n=1 Tax=Plenodomus tracheiphilus IPT5 TaxID=1408161 RepID=A0A6A7BGA0_9PLEO|nr:hypothetical protein T440DRAFT_305297 [Plenodomus tracheiphilus IPT5]